MDSKEEDPRQSPPNAPSSVPSRAKKPYVRPELQVHGPVVDRTNRVGKTGASDGGSWPRNKTKP